MKLKLWSLVFILGIFSQSLCASSSAGSFEAQPLTRIQLVAWLIGGVPSAALSRLAQSHGIDFSPVGADLRQVESAGADSKLIHVLSALKAKTSVASIPVPVALAKAAVAAHEERYHDAERLLRDVLNTDQGNAALHFALGAMLRQQEQWEDAFDEVTESARLMPDFPENHVSLAYIFYRLDDGPNAIAEARTALSMDPKNAEAYQFLGLGQYSAGQYSAAIHAYEESLVRDPENADTYYDMGIAQHANGNLPASAASYSHAIHLRPTFWEAHSNLGLILHEEGKLVEAVAEYREARRIAPEEPSIRNNLGNTYCDQGEYDAAIAELKDLFRQHPEWQQGRGCLASAYMAKKNYSQAIEELHTAVLQNPTGAAEHRVLGQALLLNSQPEEGVRELRLAVSLNPDSDTAHHYLGTALFQQQQVHAAEREFREALRLNPSADNHYSLAACLMSLERYDEALAEISVAARLDPERQLYRARREELLKLMNDSNPR